MIDNLRDALKVEPNRFALTQAVSKRAVQLCGGAPPLCDLDDSYKSEKYVSTAIREIAQGHVAMRSEHVP